jgi:hypothetical protein
MKLEVSKLDESPIEVRGYFANNAAKDLPASLHLDWDAFDLVATLKNFFIRLKSDFIRKLFYILLNPNYGSPVLFYTCLDKAFLSYITKKFQNMR